MKHLQKPRKRKSLHSIQALEIIMTWMTENLHRPLKDIWLWLLKVYLYLHQLKLVWLSELFKVFFSPNGKSFSEGEPKQKSCELELMITSKTFISLISLFPVL